MINLCPDKHAVFTEAARVLKPGGRLALADIISEQPLTDTIVCNADLWASCIGGAAQQEAYFRAIEAAGFTIIRHRDNAYEFISEQARNATTTLRRQEHLPARHSSRVKAMPSLTGDQARGLRPYQSTSSGTMLEV